MPVMYDPADWYWIVAGDKTQVWSSARKAYVPVSDTVYQAWGADGRRPTRIESETSLAAVLNDQYPAGSPQPPRQVAPLQFRRRFTDAERAAIHAAALANPTLLTWVMDAAAAQIIDLDDPSTVEAMQLLVDNTLLTPARRDAILAG